MIDVQLKRKVVTYSCFYCNAMINDFTSMTQVTTTIELRCLSAAYLLLQLLGEAKRIPFTSGRRQKSIPKERKLTMIGCERRDEAPCVVHGARAASQPLRISHASFRVSLHAWSLYITNPFRSGRRTYRLRRPIALRGGGQPVRQAAPGRATTTCPSTLSTRTESWVDADSACY